MPADKFTRGEVVHTAMGSGRIVRFQRMHRQDGWVVQNVRQGPGEGTLPHWVPETSIERGPMPPAPGGGRNIEQILGVWPGEEEEPDEPDVVDLLAALQRSIDRHRAGRDSGEPSDAAR